MATSQPPDAASLASWDAAFAYPTPIVRQLEVQLRKNIDANRHKLRTLVGTRYRDLMGTAARIIAMDADMAAAEHHLADLGRKCSARAVEQGQRHSASLGMVRERGGAREKDGERGEEVLARSALTKAVVDTMAAAARMIRVPVQNGGGDARLAAKLLVLARLLLKSVTDAQGESQSGLLDALRKRMLGLRKKLLARIERQLAVPNSNSVSDVETSEEIQTELEQKRRDSLVNSLCAYALVTSSAPADVLRYFLQSRFSQLTALTEASTIQEPELLEVLDLYGQTLSDTRMLFPRVLLDALAEVGQVPLVRDPQIVNLYELSLDIYTTWIPQNVRTFTPWIRRDQVSTSIVDTALKSWAGEAQGALIQAVKTGIATQADVKGVLSVRQTVISRYLNLGGQVRQVNAIAAVVQIQEVFRERLQTLAVDCLSAFKLGGSELAEEGPAFESLWDLANQDLSTKNGGLRLRNAILQRRHGRGRTLNTVSRRLDHWVASISQLWDVTLTMRTTRWADEVDLDDLADDDEIDTSLPDLLNKRDPEAIQQTLKEAVINAFVSLYETVSLDASAGSRSPAHLLRLLREIDIRRRKLESHLSLPSKGYTTFVLVSSLQHTLAESTLQHVWSAFSARTTSPFDSETYLWEGTPPLPIQPSPQIFQLFVELQKHMTSAGSDLWTATATAELKKLLCSNFAEWLKSQALSTVKSEPHDDAGGDTNGGDDAQRSLTIQRIFDTLFVTRLTSASAEPTALTTAVDVLCKSANLDDAERDRIMKSVTDYWKRTYLLFGLLTS